jgi:hypothetical protein
MLNAEFRRAEEGIVESSWHCRAHYVIANEQQKVCGDKKVDNEMKRNVKIWASVN